MKAELRDRKQSKGEDEDYENEGFDNVEGAPEEKEKKLDA